jgi:HK97 family phage major capsid protein
MSLTAAELKSSLDSMSVSIDKKLEDNAKLSGIKAKEDIESIDKEMKSYILASKALAEKQAEVVSELKNQVTTLLQKGVNHANEKTEVLTLGSSFVASDGFKSFLSGTNNRAQMEFKNTIVNSGNDTSRHEQLPGLVEGAFRRINVMQTLNRGTTGSNILYFSKEAGFTNNAAGTAEGASKPESALTFEEASEAIKTVAHFIKVSKQAMADSTFLASYIDKRMVHGINNAIEVQVITGDGTGQNLQGFTAASNSTAVLVGSATNFFDYTNQLKYAVIAADYNADVYYINPSDWQAAEVLKNGTGDDRYIGADGAMSYINGGLQPMLWGLPVVLSNNVPAETVICMARDASMFVDRESTVIQMFEQDGDNVTKNLLTIRAEARVAQLIFRAEAIVTADLSTIV